MPMAPTQAAQKIGVSRRTLMRAIERLEIKAYRDNRNRWKIDPEDLDKWAGAHWAPSGHTQVDIPTSPTSAPTTQDVEIERLRGEVRVERALREAAEVERDRWRGMAETLAATMPKTRRWWPWK